MFKFIIIVLLIFSFRALADATPNLILKQIDELAHKEPTKAKELLKGIKKNSLTTSDQDLYTFLSAYLLATSGQLDKAIVELLSLTEKDTSLPIQIRSHSLLLLIYAGTHDWEGGLRTLSKLTIILEKSEDEELNELVYSNIVNFYNLLGEHEIAKKYADKVVGFLNKDINKCTLDAQRVYAELRLGSESLNKQMFIDVITFCRSINSLYAAHGTYTYLAEFLISHGRLVEAEKVLMDNLKEVERTGYHTMTATFYATLAEIKLQNKEYPEAEFYARKIIATEHEHQNAESMAVSYKVLSEVTEQQQHFEQAYNYYKKYSKAIQIELDQNNAKLLAIQKAEFDAAEKNVQIALLDKENMLLKTQALLDSESAQNKRLALALLTMVLVMFVLWTYKNRRNYLRMQHYAQTDELTGIANRHYFTQQANTAIKYCKRTDQPVSFIMFDLDYFKRINDTFGHQTGDMALKIAVDAAKLACRKNDIVGRLGGEEFGVLLPGCASHLASFIAEKCRKAIEHADFTSSGHELDVTASFGIADSSNCEYNFEKLFAGADFALYQSKDMGRNRVVQYQKETTSFHI